MLHVITQISQAVKNIERVNIYLNGKFWLGLSKNNLVSLRLFKGQQLSELERREVERTAFDSNNIHKAVNYMRIRPRSCAEVRDYLVLRRKIAVEEAENVVSYLQNQELLSDEKFALWYVEYKSQTGVNGINKIKTELLQKKVNLKIINKVLEKIYGDGEFQQGQLVKIKEFAEKVTKTIKAKDSYELKSKLIQRLLARGFKYAEIKEVLKTLHL